MNQLPPAPPDLPLASALEHETLELAEIRRSGSFEGYWCPGDPLCRRVLSWATTSSRFDEVKLVFPFFRLASLFGVERVPRKLGTWLTTGFYAGLRLGLEHPSVVSAFLDGRLNDAQEAMRRIRLLQEMLKEKKPDLQHVLAFFDAVAFQFVANPPEDLDTLFADWTRGAMIVGFAAATIALLDSSLHEFVRAIPKQFDDRRVVPEMAALMASLADTQGATLGHVLRHPLLRIAEAYYPGRLIERDAMMPFFIQQLKARTILSEAYIPADEEDLVEWVAQGLEYGRRMRNCQREQLVGVWRSLGRSHLRKLRRMIRATVQASSSLEPGQLVKVIRRWQQHVFGWVKPKIYSESLRLPVHFGDYAVWIGWLRGEPDRRLND